MIKVRICPNCKSKDVSMVAGGTTGTWMCNKCGYSGSVFPEEEIIGKNMKDKEKKNESNSN